MATRDELKDLLDQLPEAHLETVRHVVLYLLPPRNAKGLSPEAQRVAALAESVFEDKGKAARWLGTPRHVFGGACPFDMLASEEGAKQVEEILHRIEYGIYS
jgi:putative toxin-antitoxin system antitoxin component (TIGR02293 family)